MLRLAKKIGVTLKKDVKESSAAVETSKTKGWKGSKPKQLLLVLLMDKKSSVHNKTDEEIYQSNELFQVFQFDYFKKNLDKLKEIAKKQLLVIEEEEADFKKEQVFYPSPENKPTNRKYPYWQYHPADELMKEDVKSGLAYELTPLQLRAKRQEYQAFPQKVLRGHIHQEKRTQREKDYWVTKRNKDAQRKREKEAKKLKEEWEQDMHNDEVESLRVRFECIESSRRGSKKTVL